MNSLKLKGARVEKGYTQEKMAKALQVAPKTYNRKELGITPFSAREISLISNTLEMDIATVVDIFFGNKLTEWLRKGESQVC